MLNPTVAEVIRMPQPATKPSPYGCSICGAPLAEPEDTRCPEHEAEQQADELAQFHLQAALSVAAQQIALVLREVRAIVRQDDEPAVGHEREAIDRLAMRTVTEMLPHRVELAKAMAHLALRDTLADGMGALLDAETHSQKPLIAEGMRQMSLLGTRAATEGILAAYRRELDKGVR